MNEDSLVLVGIVAVACVHLAALAPVLVVAVRRLRAMEQPLGCAVVVPAMWAPAALYAGFYALALAVELRPHGPWLPLVVVGSVSLAGGLFGGWLGWQVVRTLSHKNRTTGVATGAGATPAAGEAACATHKNRATGTCDRCGDFVCPACTFAARTGPGRFCMGCAPRLDKL